MLRVLIISSLSVLAGCQQSSEKVGDRGPIASDTKSAKVAASADAAEARQSYDDALGCLRQSQALHRASIQTGKTASFKKSLEVQEAYGRIVYEKAVKTNVRAALFKLALIGDGSTDFDTDRLSRCSEEFGVDNAAA